MKRGGKSRSRRATPGSKVATLRLRLKEAEETLRAIRSGEVDAVVVSGEGGDRVFTLHGAEHDYRMLIESMNEGALTLTVDATILYANGCFAKMVGCPLEQVIGSSFRRFLSAEDWATLGPLAQGSENAGTKLQAVLVTGLVSGLPVQISLRALGKEGVSGATLGLVVTDMTEAHRIASQKETERRYAEVVIQAAELERRVAERTAELLEANQELESFEASVSHDLRGPLRHVMGYSEMVLADYAAEVPESALVFIRKIRDGAARMERLIEALLEFSRVGKQALCRETVDMTTMWREVLLELRADLKNRTIDVSIGELPSCHADPILLRQVVVNLLGNALKYSRTRERSIIAISSRSQSDIQGPVYVIKDNGIGFDMKYAEKLFAVFERLPNARDFEGTGVGLTTVQRIVQRHGGRIWAESTPDASATFYFTLGDNPVTPATDSGAAQLAAALSKN